MRDHHAERGNKESECLKQSVRYFHHHAERENKKTAGPKGPVAKKLAEKRGGVFGGGKAFYCR